MHGDLHAGNILVDNDGHARLTDFGSSFIYEGTSNPCSSGGAIRWQAPELIDPERFNSAFDIPTPQSDVFSFACVVIEVGEQIFTETTCLSFLQLYTGNPPFIDLTENHVCERYLLGSRPPRPAPPCEEEMSDALWSLTQSCWAHRPCDRPSAHDVTDALRRVTRLNSSANPFVTHVISKDGSKLSSSALKAAPLDDLSQMVYNILKPLTRIITCFMKIKDAQVNLLGESVLQDVHYLVTETKNIRKVRYQYRSHLKSV